MKISSYKELESFLLDQSPMYQKIGPKAFKNNLDNINFLSDKCGHPHKEFKSIHIAGTNGKGSTSYYIATALDQLGYKVGLYTSPHYKDYRERIKVDGKMITKKFCLSFVNKLIKKEVFQSEYKPSFFELSVMMAFDYFKYKKVDYAIIETGLGGRLDATNIIKPVLSVITNIGLDHTKFLGTTLKSIAKEKAGIIKTKIPVVIGREQIETKNVFEKIAAKKTSAVHYAPDEKTPKSLKLFKSEFPLYQQENLQTAYTSLNIVGCNISSSDYKKAWTKGLHQWGFIGRYQQISAKPKVICDSAHNPAGIKYLFNQIENEDFSKLHLVFGLVADKDLESILELLPKRATYYFTQAKISRALSHKILMKKAIKYGLMGKNYKTVKKALSVAKKEAHKKDMILVFGSIFTVSEIL